MGKKSNKDSGESYKFKYIYLWLIIIFIIAIVLTYMLPRWFPNVFIDSTWIVSTNASSETKSLEYISENAAMSIINILRSISASGLTGVVLYVFYEHRFENDDKQTLFDNIDQIIEHNIESHVVKAMLSNKDIIDNMLSDSMINNVLENCLARKVNNPEKAHAILSSLLENVINKSDTIKELDVSMTLSPFIDTEHIYCAYDTYKLTYVIRYKTILDSESFVFIMTNDKSIQNTNLGKFIYCQFVDSLFSGSKVYFKINDITIDGERLILQSKEESPNCIRKIYWNKNCDSKKGEEVQICYSVEFLVRKFGNHYSYFTPFMTKEIHLKFDAISTDIERIKLLTYFNSSKKPTIIPSLGTINNPKTIEITLNDWILPFSGASFVWQFEKK